MSRPATEISYLLMRDRPQIEKPELNIIKAQAFPAWYFLALYDAVGQDYYWGDMHLLSKDELENYATHPNRTLYTLIQNGAPSGFFVLFHEDAHTELEYFGLTPQASGNGLGGALLDWAICEAFSHNEIQTLGVNTCTLDHPRALPLYLSRGFVITHKESRPALK